MASGKASRDFIFIIGFMSAVLILMLLVIQWERADRMATDTTLRELVDCHSRQLARMQERYGALQPPLYPNRKVSVWDTLDEAIAKNTVQVPEGGLRVALATVDDEDKQ